MEFEATEVEEDRVPETLAIAEATGCALHALHCGVDGFAAGVGRAQSHRGRQGECRAWCVPAARTFIAARVLPA